MRVAIFNSKSYERELFALINKEYDHELEYIEAHLTEVTAPLASGYPAVCAFVNDTLDAGVLEILHRNGTRLIALRSAGFNHIDLHTAESLGLTVVRVPAYSPHAVAEHTVGLMLTLNRKLHRAHQRVREGNFSLNGLMGFDFNDRVAGVIGTGKIGAIVARILLGFGLRVLATDAVPNKACIDLGIEYVLLPELLQRSDIITLHCPLTPDTHHLIDSTAIKLMKAGVMLINTSRGGLIDTAAVIEGLKSQKIGYLGLDVYEEEGDLFFEDLSDVIIQDDIFSRLLTFPNVFITAHQAFFTREAVTNIVDTTLYNITEFEAGHLCKNRVTTELVSG